ncbi:MAG: glycosyltransferase family 2 protein [Oligoflexus sp.]
MVQISLAQHKQNNFDLSVVIPVYNDTVKFENLLSSYYQAFKSRDLMYEIVIIDNNSPRFEEIYQVTKKFREKIQITIVMQPPLSHPFALCSARNRGVLNARGRYILFTDSDCMVDENFTNAIEEIGLKDDDSSTSEFNIYTGERVFILVPNEVMTSEDILQEIPKLSRVPSASNYGMIKDRRFPWIQNLPHQEHPWNFVHGCFILLKKSDYLCVGGSDTSYDGFWGYEEIDLVYRMVMQLKAKVRYLEKAKVFHQEFRSDLDKIHINLSRTNKSLNPNYQKICQLIPGFDEFKKVQWKKLNIKTS